MAAMVDCQKRGQSSISAQFTRSEEGQVPSRGLHRRNRRRGGRKRTFAEPGAFIVPYPVFRLWRGTESTSTVRAFLVSLAVNWRLVD